MLRDTRWTDPNDRTATRWCEVCQKPFMTGERGPVARVCGSKSCHRVYTRLNKADRDGAASPETQATLADAASGGDPNALPGVGFGAMDVARVIALDYGLGSSRGPRRRGRPAKHTRRVYTVEEFLDDVAEDDQVVYLVSDEEVAEFLTEERLVIREKDGKPFDNFDTYPAQEWRCWCEVAEQPTRIASRVVEVTDKDGRVRRGKRREPMPDPIVVEVLERHLTCYGHTILCPRFGGIDPAWLNGLETLAA